VDNLASGSQGQPYLLSVFMICLCLDFYAIFPRIVPDKILQSVVRFVRHFVAFLVLCVIEAISWLALFGSNRFLDHFGLASVAQKWRSFFSLIFLCSTTLIILWMLDFFNRQILDKWEDH
jgi:hypothetical protein